jgi:MFS family permease
VAGAALVGYIGASSVLGRLGLNAFAPRFGLMTMYLTSYAILLLSFGFWLAAHAYPLLATFSLVMGVGYGGIAAMAPAVTASIFGVEALGELLGILFTALGAACLVGPPVAGALIDSMHDSKLPVFVAAAAAILAMIFVVPLRKYAVEEREPVAKSA